MLKTALGYGGLIHNFKNYVLRDSTDFFTNANIDAQYIRKLIALFRKTNVNPIENSALDDLLKIVGYYQKNLHKISKMKQQGDSTNTIDRAVVINDKPALDALNTLNQQITIHTNMQVKTLNNSLNIVQISNEMIFFITLIAFTLLIISTVWLLYYKIIQPISKLTDVMSELSNNNLDIEIFATDQNTEIGDMARSVDIFKLNGIKKIQAEKALQQSNEQLENRVKERTKSLSESKAHLSLLANKAIDGQQRLNTIINTAMDAVVQMDCKGMIIHWNNQAEIIFGRLSKDVLGLPLHEVIIPQQYREMHTAGLQRFLTTESPKILNTRIEITALNSDEEEFPVELTIAAIKEKDSYHFCAFIRDITQQKTSQEIMISAKEEAELANLAKSEFLANMSHELRTPLHGILSFANFGIKKSESAERSKLNRYFTNIHISGFRLLNLLNDLLDLSKLEAGKMDLNIQTNNLTILFEQCIAEQQQQIEDFAIKIIFNKAEQPVIAECDNAYITQIMTNLLSNALKFSGENTTITADLHQVDDTDSPYVEFIIKDQGPGIPEDELISIFDAFIQSSQTDTGAGGTGLGLAICKKLIDHHSGKIWAENSADEGAIFTFIIPTVYL